MTPTIPDPLRSLPRIGEWPVLAVNDPAYFT